MTTALTLKDLPPPPAAKSGWPWTTHNKRLPEKMPDGCEWPRLSIVTPSYNQGKFIEATIRSVLLQGYPNLEYIIIDGGSTDNSVETIKKYDKYLFYWHSKKDRGQADAINQGLEKSSGQILGWINSDDVYVKGTFNKIAKAFHFYPNCIVVHGNRILINEIGEVTGWMCLPPFDPKALIYNVCSETAFWQRAVMKEAGILNASLQFAIDLEFFGRLYKYGEFMKLNEYLGYFRCYSENKSSTMAHIGREEAAREWRRLFGSDIMNGELKQKKNILKFFTFFTELIKKPILLGFPYLLHRF
ncbi:MAG: glycosyltransferase [Nostoc sp. C3-bin3]|nr:glycosyltransferase [Nostoc sp. C3-bin3]